METKWTPGPWRVGSKTDGYATSVVSANETVWYQSAGGNVPLTIAALGARSRESYKEMNANGNLISAAPDMAEALATIEHEIGLLMASVGYQEEQWLGPFAHHIQDAARAALRKARGEV